MMKLNTIYITSLIIIGLYVGWTRFYLNSIDNDLSLLEEVRVKQSAMLEHGLPDSVRGYRYLMASPAEGLDLQQLTHDVLRRLDKLDPLSRWYLLLKYRKIGELALKHGAIFGEIINKDRGELKDAFMTNKRRQLDKNEPVYPIQIRRPIEKQKNLKEYKGKT